MKGSILVNGEWVIERGRGQQTMFCLLFNGFVSPLPRVLSAVVIWLWDLGVG